ncbi:hypothetical protein ACVWZ4_001050 [Bradyrhizobium sp. USDA 4472]
MRSSIQMVALYARLKRFYAPIKNAAAKVIKHVVRQTSVTIMNLSPGLLDHVSGLSRRCARRYEDVPQIVLVQPEITAPCGSKLWALCFAS